MLADKPQARTPYSGDMWRAELTVFAVISFIAAFICLIVYWHRAGDVSQAKTEADCQKAGGMWDSR